MEAWEPEGTKILGTPIGTRNSCQLLSNSGWSKNALGRSPSSVLGRIPFGADSAPQSVMVRARASRGVRCTIELFGSIHDESRLCR